MNENFLHQAAKASAELFHSNMLAYLWQLYPDLANAHLTCNMLPGTVAVLVDDIAREKHNIDILVVTDERVVGLENKFKSRHSAEQLGDYRKKLQRSYPLQQTVIVALCTTAKDARETKTRLGPDVVAEFISYENNVIPFLKAVILRAEERRDKRSLFYLRDYLEVIEDLLKLVAKHEDPPGNFGAALARIADDKDVERFRLGPLMQRRLFERLHGKAKALTAGTALEGTFELNDINLGSRSKLGQITAKLRRPVTNEAFEIHVGVQLEGQQLRRFVTFEKIDKSRMTEKDKTSVHKLATDFARQHGYFADAIGEAARPLKPRHFKATEGLDSFLAYANTESVFFVYLNLAGDCGGQSLDEVAQRLKMELDRLELFREKLGLKTPTLLA